jgi:hypothetical protein
MMRGEHDRGYRITHLTGDDHGLCTLLYQGLGECMTYTAKAGLINVPKIVKGAAAMHCGSLPVIRVHNMVCTRVLTLPFSAEVLQNVDCSTRGIMPHCSRFVLAKYMNSPRRCPTHP